ncbi:hypothetical protein FBU30_007088 [Linnemannia zychae]|nr:hypothetical protein FBU30_007088 [Linnemannia zychae]
MPTKSRLYALIPYLRGAIAFLSLGCFVTLFSYPKQPRDPFYILQQLGLNICICFAYGYSLYSNNSPNHKPIYPIYRMSLICTAFVLSWVYGMGPLVKIFGSSGTCRAEQFSDAPGRCWMQVGVSMAEVLWTILMFCEGLITDKRNRDKAYRQEMGWEIEEEDAVLASRARAQVAEAEAAARYGVVQYQPDLSLDGNGGSAGTRTGRRRVVGVNDDHEDDGADQDLEMEPLPPYMPKARRDQAVIIDMTNLPQQQPILLAAAAATDTDAGNATTSHDDTTLPRDPMEQESLQEHQSIHSNAATPAGPTSTLTAILPQVSAPVQQQSPQHDAEQHQIIHPQGGPGTGLPRVPSYSE